MAFQAVSPAPHERVQHPVPTPAVSILITTHNAAGVIGPCLESLRATLPQGLHAEVLVYDDHSTDATPDRVVRFHGFAKLIRSRERSWFARQMNALMPIAKGRWHIALNPDTLARPGWLEPMLDLAESTRRPGIVGNLQVYPRTHDRPSAGGCPINHAGVVFESDKRPCHLYEGLPESLPAAHATRELQAVSAACWLADAELIRTLGGFDEHYKNGHEDIDLCLRVRQAGRSVWYTGDSVIEHHGSSTPGRFDAINANQRRFEKRWKPTIEPDAERIAAADGVDWPDRSRAYLLARSVWRFPPTRAVLNLAMRTPVGTALRQRAFRKLTTRD